MIPTLSVVTDRLQHVMSLLAQGQPVLTDANDIDLKDASAEGEKTVARNRTVGEENKTAVDPAELQTPSDVLAKLGQLPEEFVIHLLESNDGRLKQQAFTELTAWSPSTTSRLLQELEEDGHIVRVQIGIEKIVYLPEEAPTSTIEPPHTTSTELSVTHN
ncbi:helix-turn-helix domain-containing protein [Haladaptatus sp. DYSN1]|uniref:helix-turn-helix transcriptional regulator n=1 Tax=unclassified Haladaptatus TaxID=2622732 RepID=UPI0024063ED8|nr:helix-turn-helix domain-containing protein [Haladaptatus sp. DYSN1]